ncbi:MAG: chromate transporter [Oscillospiraceae bacterium]|nr:chromate transporter [Oscillospiraceae bacterium]
MILLTLFFEFFKTGLFAVGGGMATLPFLYDMSARHPDWFTTAQLADMIAVSESTPGPIGVNMATYVGFRTAGILGGLVATLGLAAPSVIIILLIARVLRQFRENRYVDAAFYGLRPCSVGLIAAAGLLVVKIALFDFDAYAASGALTDLFNVKALILAAVLLVLTRAVKATKKLHPIFFILGAAVAGVVFSF